jgi:hypothetical protein
MKMDNLEFDRLLNLAAQIAERAGDNSASMEYRHCYMRCLSSIYMTLEQLAADLIGVI